ncbi:MAG: hypothetical protein ACI35W_00485 [Anaeroplasmataceae bacterium]
MIHEDDIERFISDNIEKSFNEVVLSYIIKNNLDSVFVYNKANLHRRIYSRLFNKNYTPSKNTAICLCIALEFNYETTVIMLRKLGYTFSTTSEFDLIVSYYIKNSIYDIDEINDYLDVKGHKILGSIIKEKEKIKKKKKIKEKEKV